MRKHGTTGTTMFGQRHPKTFFLQILSNSGCQGAMQTWSYASRGSLGRGSICDSGISASEAALGVGELSEPLRTVCSSCLHVVTAMNLWQFVDTCRIPFGSKVASVTCKRRPPISRWLCERPTCANQNEHRIDKQPPNESKSSTEPSKYAAGTNETIMKPYGSIT